MPYTKHDFMVGQQLTSKIMNEIDTQLENVTKIAEIFTPEMVTSEVSRLTLASDGDRIILYYGDIEIGSASVGDISALIPCTGLSVTSSTPIAVIVGDEPVKIQCALQPTDCNQALRFLSSDRTIASVNSQGYVTGIDAGRTTVNALCGRYTMPVQVSVSKVLRPDSMVSGWLQWMPDDTPPGISAALDPGRYCTLPYGGREGIKLKAGQRLTVNCYNDSFWQACYIIAETEEGLYDGERWNGAPIVHGCTLVEDLGTGTGQKNLVYTATQDCYVVMNFQQIDQCETLVEAIDAGYYSLFVDVPPEEE